MRTAAVFTEKWKQADPLLPPSLAAQWTEWRDAADACSRPEPAPAAGNAIRGLLVASALAASFWCGLYLLLR
jgi:hypothetical protein